jgi:hypothetical protein
MITINHRQMQVLERQALERLQRQLQGTVVRVFPHLAPAAGAAPTDLEQLVERGIDSAIDHELLAPGDWAAFIALGLALRRAGQNQTPDWVVASLTDEALPGPSRLALVEHLLAEASAEQPKLGQVRELMQRARSDTLTWASSTS